MLRCPPGASALQVRRCQSSLSEITGVRGLGAELSPSVRIRVETSAKWPASQAADVGEALQLQGSRPV